MKNTHIVRRRVLAFAVALVSATALVQSQTLPDSCVQNVFQPLGAIVPFKMTSTSPYAGTISYSGSATNGTLQIYAFGNVFNYLAGSNLQLFDTRSACTLTDVFCLGTGNQPFDIKRPDSQYLQIYDWQGQIIVYIVDQTTNTSTVFQGQCGGPGNALLYGSDNTNLYVISLGTPVPQTTH